MSKLSANEQNKKALEEAKLKEIDLLNDLRNSIDMIDDLEGDNYELETSRDELQQTVKADNLQIGELQRLNESFGIGVIKLTKDIYDSKILFEARYKELDFKTIDKLCNINTEYNDFISLIEKYLNANEKYKEISLNELKEFSDDYFKSEDEIITYCKKNNIRDDD